MVLRYFLNKFVASSYLHGTIAPITCHFTMHQNIRIHVSTLLHFVVSLIALLCSSHDSVHSVKLWLFFKDMTVVFVTLDKCRCFTIVNGKAGVFDMEECGLTISYKEDCLPSSIKKCKILISADLTTDIPLPSGSLLVSGVYNITMIPFIHQLNQPVELSMEHCAFDFNQLCFIEAKDQNQHEFKYIEGGRFEIDAKTGRRIGRICVSSFSFKAISTQDGELLTGQENTPNEPEVKNCISYFGTIYYDDTTFSYRNIHFVITKDLLLAKDVSSHSS